MNIIGLSNSISLRRSLRGNVDRNSAALPPLRAARPVVPYVGTWIEIVALNNAYEGLRVVPYVGTWIEM